MEGGERGKGAPPTPCSAQSLWESLWESRHRQRPLTRPGALPHSGGEQAEAVEEASVPQEAASTASTCSLEEAGTCSEAPLPPLESKGQM